MRLLIVCFALVMVLPHAASAAEQCTTGTLDLVCDEGEVLRGIKPSGSKICVTEGSGSGGGSFVALESGEVNQGDVVLPIEGYTRSQCTLSLQGKPGYLGAYKRGRNYSVWHVESGNGWKLHAGALYPQDRSIRLSNDASIQYQLACSGVNTSPPSYTDLVCADDEFLQGINVLGEKICRKAGQSAGQLYQCPDISIGLVRNTRSTSTSITDSNCYGQKSANPSCTYVRKISASKASMSSTVTVVASCAPID